MTCRRALLGFLVTTFLAASYSLTAPAARAQSEEDLVESGHVRIRASIKPEIVLVGQRAELVVEVLTDTWFLGAPTYPQTLEVENAVVIPPGAFGVNSSERIGSDTFAVQARSYLIFPVTPGKISIPPVDISVIVAKSDASRSEPIPLRSEPLVLTASVPEAARGLGLVVAAPSLEVDETWSRSLDGLLVGDAVTRTVSQRVEGSVPMVLPAPRFEASAGLGVYPERPRFEQETNRGELSGSRVDSVTYVFEEPGSFVLSEIALPWWNLGKDELIREVFESVTLEVAANPDLASEHLQAPVDETGETDPATEDTSPSSNEGLRTALAVALILLAAWLARHRLAKLYRNIRRSLHKPEDPEAKAWTELQRSLSGRDREQILVSLYRWRDSFEGLPGPPTLESLCDPTLDAELAASLSEIQNPDSSAKWSPKALERGLAALRARLRSSEAHLRATSLGPLNPTAS